MVTFSLLFVPIENDLAEIRGASFWSDRPHDIGQVLRPEPRRRLQVIELDFNFDVSCLLSTLASPRASGNKAVPRKSTFVAPSDVDN